MIQPFHRRRAVLTGSLALVLLGCSENISNAPSGDQMADHLQQFLTGNAAARLDANGRFLLASPESPHGVPMITPDRAKDLATAFLRTWGRSHRRIWEAQRGAPIDVGSLRASPRVYFAQTPHGPLSGVHDGAYQRPVGPWYIVHFLHGGDPVIGVAVSAYSTDLKIRNGVIVQPRDGGNYFVSRGVAAGPGDRAPYVPVSPEDAVEAVSKRTGAKVQSVPELVVRSAGWSPLRSQWRIVLDQEVEVLVRRAADRTGPGERRRVRELFLGPGAVLSVPAPGQQGSIRLPVQSFSGNRESPVASVFIEVPTRPQMAVEFDQVVQTGEGQ